MKIHRDAFDIIHDLVADKHFHRLSDMERRGSKKRTQDLWYTQRDGKYLILDAIEPFSKAADIIKKERTRIRKESRDNGFAYIDDRFVISLLRFIEVEIQDEYSRRPIVSLTANEASKKAESLLEQFVDYYYPSYFEKHPLLISSSKTTGPNKVDSQQNEQGFSVTHIEPQLSKYFIDDSKAKLNSLIKSHLNNQAYLGYIGPGLGNRGTDTDWFRVYINRECQAYFKDKADNIFSYAQKMKFLGTRVLEEAKFIKISDIHIWDVNIYDRNLDIFDGSDFERGVYGSAMVFYNEGLRMPFFESQLALQNLTIEHAGQFVDLVNKISEYIKSKPNTNLSDFLIKDLFKATMTEKFISGPDKILKKEYFHDVGNSLVPIFNDERIIAPGAVDFLPEHKYIEVPRLMKFRFFYNKNNEGTSANDYWQLLEIIPINSNDITTDD